MNRILIVEDDSRLAEQIASYLVQMGYAVIRADSGRAALICARDFLPDIVLLDLILPDGMGYDLCADLRQIGPCAILAISAINETGEILKGFRRGIDDHLAKPFSFAELLARIEALLRRASHTREGLQPYVDDYLFFDPLRQIVEIQGQRRLLSRIEYIVFSRLVAARGDVISRDDLAFAVWHRAHPRGVERLAACLSRLRAKIEPDPHHPRYLLTVRGEGYRFAAQDGDS